MQPVMVKLEQIRRKMKLTQKSLCALIGITRGLYHRLKNTAYPMRRRHALKVEHSLQLPHGTLAYLISEQQKTCVVCAGVFWPVTSHHIFCSQKCKAASSHKQAKKTGAKKKAEDKYYASEKGKNTRKQISIRRKILGTHAESNKRYAAKQRVVLIADLAAETERLAKLEQERAELQALKERRAREDYQRRLAQAGE